MRSLLVLVVLLLAAGEPSAPTAATVTAYVARALQLAPGGFSTIRGARVDAPTEMYATTEDLPGAMPGGCEVSQLAVGGVRWMVTCRMNVTDHGAMRAMLVAAMPPDFRESTAFHDRWERWDGAIVSFTTYAPATNPNSFGSYVSVAQGDPAAAAPAPNAAASAGIAKFITTLLAVPPDSPTIRGPAISGQSGFTLTIAVGTPALSDCRVSGEIGRWAVFCQLSGYHIGSALSIPPAAEGLVRGAVPAGFERAGATPASVMWTRKDGAGITLVQFGGKTIAFGVLAPSPIMAAAPASAQTTAAVQHALGVLFPLAPAGFAGGATSIAATFDPRVFAGCTVGQRPAAAYVGFPCSLVPGAFASAAEAAKAIGSAMPHDFQLYETPPTWTWTRESDFLEVALDPYCSLVSLTGTLCVSVAQTVKPQTNVLDGSITPVPTIWREPAQNNVQRGAGGLVIADDGAQSYVVTHYDVISAAPPASDIFLVGSPITSTLWRYQRATLIGWNKGLALLSVPHLRIRPAEFARATPARGQALKLYAVQTTADFDHKNAGDDVTLTVNSRSSTVSAVHGDSDDLVIEYTGGSADTLGGDVLVDGAGRVVGLTSGSVPGTQGVAFIAAEPATLAKLATQSKLTLTYAPSVPSAVAAATASPSAGALPPIFARVRPAVVQIFAAERGSGVIVKRNAAGTYVLTAGHVIQKAPTINVFTASAQTPITATLVGESQNPDLALLRIPATPVQPVALSAGVQRASAIFVLGFPASEYSFNDVKLFRVAEPKLDEGIVDEVNVAAGTFDHDAATDEGNSGGPIFDRDGKLAGIVEGTPANGSGTYTAIALSAIRTFVQRFAP